MGSNFKFLSQTFKNNFLIKKGVRLIYANLNVHNFF
jgi:hypothetical protein